MKQATLDHEGKHVPMKVIMKGFWLKLLWGTLQTMLENQKQKATHAHEGKNVFLKGKVRIFAKKVPGRTLRKRLEHHEKHNLCL